MRPQNLANVVRSIADSTEDYRIIVMAANPGRVHAEIPVPFAYPRTAQTRLTREYHDLVAEVSRVLRSVETAAA
jgi:NitT/TauT family transport system ATP-binding protein